VGAVRLGKGTVRAACLFGVICLAPGTVEAFDFRGIPLATTVDEAQATLPDRYERLLEQAANTRLPNATDDDDNEATHPQMDSRGDVGRLTLRATARILLGQPVDDVEEILRDPSTLPFAPTGSSFSSEAENPLCYRRGDYDFALVDLVRLAYVARDNPGSLSDEAFRRLVREVLNLRGNSRRAKFSMRCLGVRVHLTDTENHILMSEISQYLTNQLLAELPEHAGDPLYDNVANGNRDWMLRHLQQFFFSYFEEYNSRPYQGYAIRPIVLLHAYAEEEEVRLAAGMVLDLVSAWTAVQSNGLRRFAPFRRQPKYIMPDGREEFRGHFSWDGDHDADRLAFLAGNFGHLIERNFVLANGSSAFYAAVGHYRLDEVLLDLAIRKDLNPYYFVARHANAEMYSSSASFLLSAGGHFDRGIPPAFEGLGLFWPLSTIVNSIVAAVTDKQHGWGRETVVVPTNATTADVRQLIRFEGHENLFRRNNLCVAPGFACGLTVRLPDHVLANGGCVERQGDWLFFDFTRPGCPQYDGYLALYQRSCDTSACRKASANDTYGFLEVADAAAVDWEDFRASALSNGLSFSSSALHEYVTVAGTSVEFTINAPLGRRAITAIDGEPFSSSLDQWPLVRGNAISSSTPGRVSIDSQGTSTRLILDYTHALAPQRVRTVLPELDRSPSFGGAGGNYFDDGGDVVCGAELAWVELCSGRRVDRIRAGYRDTGFEVIHGGGGGRCRRLEFGPGERLDEVGLGLVRRRRDDRIGFLRLRTSRGREIRGGRARERIVLQAAEGEHFIAFRGRSGGEVDRLGLIRTPVVSPESCLAP
jgi:hypothetical protein